MHSSTASVMPIWLSVYLAVTSCDNNTSIKNMSIEHIINWPTIRVSMIDDVRMSMCRCLQYTQPLMTTSIRYVEVMQELSMYDNMKCTVMSPVLARADHRRHTVEMFAHWYDHRLHRENGCQIQVLPLLRILAGKNNWWYAASNRIMNQQTLYRWASINAHT